jgi:hypothetical protein
MSGATFDFAALPVTITAMGPDKKDDWEFDAWRVTFSNKSGNWSTTYKTGIGLRKYPKGFKPDKTLNPRCVAYADQEARKVAVKPSIADVMYSLIIDASAADQNFHDWCSNYGYSNDSIKALHTYTACIEISAVLRRYFDHTTLEQMREAVQDM